MRDFRWLQFNRLEEQYWVLYAYDLGNVDISKFLDTILEGEKIRNRKTLSSYDYLMGQSIILDKIG